VRLFKRLGSVCKNDQTSGVSEVSPILFYFYNFYFVGILHKPPLNFEGSVNLNIMLSISTIKPGQTLVDFTKEKFHLPL
jgi:hypothetical protein